MSFALTTNVVYGVKITHEQAFEFLKELEKTLISKGCPKIDMLNVDEVNSACQNYLSLDYFELKGLGADARRSEETEWFSSPFGLEQYVLGFVLGGNGYGCSDDVEALLQSPIAPNLQKQWTSILAPILKTCGITQQPDMKTTQQVH